ncbi:hypothetical protein K402DRAFT_398198 [Aulographum hederae CBS 113979]|uniref:DUF2423 domain-containing protein n=1 Tax=Aulographum hederae CBS 113979 TaxID=1176131 RepID=A0A6G1GLT9_9PEZI|nr:hypothetical protein K402DRAFT_398198 [Aulographum hederae CBS 113979]
MSKGLRSTIKKQNKSRLRARVFGPVEAARTQRLSAKLVELAAQPKPESTKMELDKENQPKGQEAKASGDVTRQTEDMDVDAEYDITGLPASSKSKSKTAAKKGARFPRRRQKASNQLTFPSYSNRKRGAGPGFTNKSRR